ncbi:MAG: glycosyltransferase family 1 protein [Chloroflexota bacterium]|nr:glycosyltransferase family 1 protein [Chloroflexota bacterium]
MRIGIDARLIYYSKVGISQYTLRLIQGLAEIEQKDEFLILRDRRDSLTITDNDDFERIDLWTPSHHRFEQLGLRFELSSLGLDLLHSPDFIPPFHRNFKSVITIHDLAFLLYPHFLTQDSARYYGQINQAVKSTDHIIAVSESTKQDTIRLLGVPESKITVIYEAANPIYRPMDKDKAKAYVGSTYGLEEYLLFVSTIEPRKNLPTLLHAFRILQDQYKIKAKLAIVGRKGWLSEEISALVEKLQLKEGVRFLGRVPLEDLVRLYNGAQALVHPSFYEGFGLPPLEAMLCGTPVICSDVSALPEVVGDAALLVSPEEVSEWTVAMHQVLHDQELRAEMRAKGYKRAECFSVEKTARQTLEVYKRIIFEE